MNNTPKDSLQHQLQQQGAEALSDVELLAILLERGSNQQTALTLAKELLKSFGDLPHLLAAEPEHYAIRCSGKTLPIVVLKACVELKRRYLLGGVKSGDGFWDLKDASQFLPPLKVAQSSGVFLSLFFDDTKQHLISVEEVLCESQHGALVSQGEPLITDVMERVLQHQAAAVTLMHYSPGGEGCPTPFDIAIGQLLLDALDAEQVTLLDFFVIGKGDSVSLFERNFLDSAKKVAIS